MNMNTDSAFLIGGIGTLINLAVAFGVHLSGTQSEAILKTAMFVISAAPLAYGWWTRSKVFSPAATQALVTKALDELPPADSAKKAAEMVAEAKDAK